MKRLKDSAQQFQFLFYEMKRMNNIHWWRWIGCWFSSSFLCVASYRIERALFLLLGNGWPIMRILLSPLLFLLRPFIGKTEIHYRCNIGKGLIVLHPNLGIVINGNAIIGENLTLTGGNCIGGREKLIKGALVIGDNVSLGANAVILGPIKIGSNVKIGAGAVVIKDADDNVTLIGVPAKERHLSVFTNE